MKKLILLLIASMFLISSTSAAVPIFIEHTIGSSPSINNVEDAVIIDFDGDGDLDIITASQNSDEITWWNNTGDNITFIDVLILNDANTDQVNALIVLDFDGDGDLDIVYGARGEDRIAWLENDGSNTSFTDNEICESGNDCDEVRDIQVIDFDGDGDYDILGAMTRDDEINLFTNDGSNTSFTVTTVLSGANLDQVRRIQIVDFDSDNDYDIFYTSWQENRVAVGVNDGSNTSFTDTQICESNSLCENPQGFIVIDFDKDGDYDVVTSGSNDDQLLWFENDGSNSSWIRHLVASGGGAVDDTREVDVIDYNHDGYNDIVAASFTDDRLGVWINDGDNLAFTETLIVDSGTTANGAFFVKAVDFDGDNDYDFFLSSHSTDRFAWWETNESRPTFTNLSVVTSIVAAGGTVNITVNNETDKFNETIFLYCDATNRPVSSNTDCTGGTTSSAPPYNVDCLFTASTTESNYTEFCKVYDGFFYSNISNITYEVDATAPTTSVTSVAQDTAIAYYDTVNDALTEILVEGEASMVCRWSSSDLAYSGMSNACTITGSQGNCSINDVGSEGTQTRYIACQDQAGNGQNATQNLNIDFILDYTAPTTSDNSVTDIQVPPYTITLTENDNVDSDPTTLYCIDTTNTCEPASSIDNAGQVIFTTSNRGTNYFRLNSTDDAGNQQTTQSSTININQLPVFTSASDDATTIKGGASVNITTVLYDPDSDPLGQNVTLWVCNSTSISAAGCGSGDYCNVTGDGNQSSAGNLSCIFTSESDSVSHTWHAFLYDAVNETAISIQSGSYTTDSTAPSITLLSPTNASTITQTSVTIKFVTDEALDWAAYSLNGNANVTMTNNSASDSVVFQLIVV